MDRIITKIDLDVYSPNQYDIIYAQQGDAKTRFIEASIYYGGEPYLINTDDMGVSVMGTRPDGKGYMYSVPNDDINDNVVLFELNKDILAVQGTVDMKIGIYQEDTLLSTVPFKVRVRKNPFDTGEVIQDPGFQALLNALIEAQRAVDVANAALQVAESTEDMIAENEQVRNNAELDRVNAEEARVIAEATRESNENTRINNETTRTDEFAQIKEDSATAITNTEKVIKRAEEAATLCENIAAQKMNYVISGIDNEPNQEENCFWYIEL